MSNNFFFPLWKSFSSKFHKVDKYQNQMLHNIYLTMYMVHWNVKIAHGLTRMKITSKNTVSTSFSNQICNKFSCNGFTTLSLKKEPVFRMA